MTELARQIDPGCLSLEAFLEWEEAQGLRYERVGPSIVAMTGGTLDHNTIALNLAFALRERLQGSDCRVFAADVRVVTPGKDVMYPDVVVACGERSGRDREIRDPVVIVEVLSQSTEARDHGIKRWAYATIPSLRHYVLVAQDRAEAEVTTRDGEVWRSVYLRDREARLQLDALGFALVLEEVVAGVEPPPATAATDGA